MTDRSHWILVVGYGSIGRRHFRSLQSLGHDDVRLLRTSEPRPGAFESPPGVKVYHCLADALADGPSLVVVANPTSLHADAAAAALKAGANVLLEKPVAGDMKAAQKIVAAQKDSPATVSMAYCFRYHMLYRQLYDAVKGGRLGRVFHAHTWQAGDLPSWHPWEDYHASYAARAELGAFDKFTIDSSRVIAQSAETNLTASISQIFDADIAVETANFIKAQILSSATVASLRITSERRSLVHDLLAAI